MLVLLLLLEVVASYLAMSPALQMLLLLLLLEMVAGVLAVSRCC